MSPETYQSPLILDGGFSRELMRLGAPFKQPEWSALSLIEAPAYVSEVHRAFAEAGVDIITTNSYALVHYHIGEERFNNQAEELATLAGRLAREVADEYTSRGRKVLVAGSLPPIFGSYEPSKFDAKTVQTYLRVLVRAMAPYVDLWLGETLSLIAEAEAVRAAISTSGKPLWISFTLDDESKVGNESIPCLRSEETVPEAAEWALTAGVEALLFNCSSPEVMSTAIQTTRDTFAAGLYSAPLIGVYANGFESQTRETAANESISTSRKDLTPELYLEFARQWVANGAKIIGGCCGVGCEHVRMLAEKLRKPTSRS